MFYVEQCHQQAETELNCLLASEGIWGKYIAELQSKNKLSFDATNNNDEQKSFVDTVIEAQQHSIDNHPDLIWKSSFKCEMPILYKVARHVLVMSTQSADVEHLCKAHKLVHTIMWNCLKNTTVLKLIYCYINLCLLNKYFFSEGTDDGSDDMVHFLEQSIVHSLLPNIIIY